MTQKKAKIFSVVNQKGGVGKTTTAVNIAASFALSGIKTLLIDIDPQGNASTGLGIAMENRSNTIYDVMINGLPMREAIVSTQIKNLDLISSTVDLSASEIELVEVKNREFVLKNALFYAINEYDCVIIDCPPSLGLLTVNALCASELVLIPMQCEFFALEGLSHLLTSLKLIKENLNADLKIGGIVLTMRDPRNRLTEQVENDVRDFLGDKVFVNSIPRNIKLSEAPSHGTAGVIYDPKCSGAVAYQKLAAEIVEREFGSVANRSKARLKKAKEE